MRLHEVNKGQRFEFETRHRGHIFKITEKTTHNITYEDVATGKEYRTSSIRRTFSMDVVLIEEGRIKEKVTVERAGGSNPIKIVAEISSNQFITQELKRKLEDVLLKLLTD